MISVYGLLLIVFLVFSQEQYLSQQLSSQMRSYEGVLFLSLLHFGHFFVIRILCMYSLRQTYYPPLVHIGKERKINLHCFSF